MRLFLPTKVDLLRKVRESPKLIITQPKNGQVFNTTRGESSKLITISGNLDPKENLNGRKILVIIRTDKDYPQALGIPLKSGRWSFSNCRLGGVDHLIFAVLVDYEDNPILCSKAISVRLLRK